MTTATMPALRREGIATMLRDRAVIVTAILTTGFVLVCFLVALAWLAHEKSDAGTILSLVATVVSVITLWRVESTRGRVDTVVNQTNGQQSKMIDALAASNPPGANR